jgi:hypothetical protein
MKFTVCGVVVKGNKKVMRFMTVDAPAEKQAIETIRRTFNQKPQTVDLIERIFK